IWDVWTKWRIACGRIGNNKNPWDKTSASAEVLRAPNRLGRPISVRIPTELNETDNFVPVFGTKDGNSRQTKVQIRYKSAETECGPPRTVGSLQGTPVMP